MIVAWENRWHFATAPPGFPRVMTSEAQFRHRSTHVPNLTDELSTARERCQFGTVVLVWCGNSVKFDRCCRTFAELKLGSTHGALSESDVAPVSLQSNLLNKNALTAASSFACLEIRSRNEEAINSTRNRIYSLKVFYFLFYRRRYFLLVSELI